MKNHQGINSSEQIPTMVMKKISGQVCKKAVEFAMQGKMEEYQLLMARAGGMLQIQTALNELASLVYDESLHVSKEHGPVIWRSPDENHGDENCYELYVNFHWFCERIGIDTVDELKLREKSVS